MEGSTLGGYRISAKLGAGGMGEVWRATDEKLGREVALKVLPALVAGEPELLARFQREARVLASLNHPSIATLFGLEAFDGRNVLVMELVEGEDLSERIARGPVPVADAASIALQIAQALEAAHDKGIVHRDLKPANVKLRPDGTVKVLDFGLAKAWDEDPLQNGRSASQRITRHDTKAGVILGTAAYMAPEQAAGLATDRRADVWSFGVVLWEMLTGRKLFEGETISHVLASVLRDTPDLSALPEDVPPVLHALVGSCLRKKPARRLQSIGDARVTLEDLLAQPEAFSPAPVAAPAAPARPRGARAAIPWAVAAVSLAAALGAGLLALRRPEAPIVKATLPAPEGAAFSLSSESPGPVAVSPDGRSLAFAAEDSDGKVRLFVRNLDATTAHPLSGTDGAGYPFWSPDSRWLGFVVRSERVLRKIDVTGGPPLPLCAAPDAKGGSWSPEGTIVFSPDVSGPLHAVPATGGTSKPITKVDAANHSSHRHPRFLPDGRRFLFLARGVAPNRSAILLGSLDGGEPREVVRNTSQGEYASGRLLFARDGVLVAQPFDPTKGAVSGEAVPLAEEVLMLPGAALSVFSASANGVLAYLTGKAGNLTTLEWRDREGKLLGTLGDPAHHRAPRISPDGRSVAVMENDAAIGTHDLWIYDVERGLRTRFTFDPGDDASPAWAPDGKMLYFSSTAKEKSAVYRKSLEDAGEAEPVSSSPDDLNPTSVSPDGRFVLVDRSPTSTSTESDLMALPVGPAAAPTPLRATSFWEGEAAFSPDGRWVAFVSNESGRFEVYVTPFPGPGRSRQVSPRTGVYPAWRKDGRELVWIQLDGQITSAEVSADGDTFHVGQAKTLFQLAPPTPGGTSFSLSPDGKRFLVAPQPVQKPGSLMTLVLGWPRELEPGR